MLVLDTHVAVWWSFQPQLLSPGATRAIQSAERLFVPTIAFWEVALLARENKLKLEIPVGAWANRICSIPRLSPLALTTDIAVLADSLAMHPDPADRFIVATALVHQVPLVTKDTLIRPLDFIDTIW